MKYFNKIILILTLIVFTEQLQANTLMESLNSAYKNNSKLNAERASMRASKEEKKEAVSEFLPSITISGYASEQDNTGGVADSNFKPSEQSMLIEQKIFQGFGGVANFKKKNYGESLAKFQLKKIEQETLLSATEAHTGYLLNKEKVKINLINIDILERQVETAQNRLEKGEINLADLAQFEASLAGAKAELITAKNDLITSELNFEKIIGKKPQDKTQIVKNINLNLPKSLAASYKIASSENPDLQIALMEYEQAKLDVVIASSDLSPSATLSYEVAEQDDMSATIKDRTQKTITATASWPLFKGGSNYFGLKKVKEIKNQKQLLFEDSKKSNETAVANAWSSLQSSKSVLNSIKSQVRAAEIANEGITSEYESGNSRTTLEVSQSRQALLDARINLATSNRNFLISQFNLLSAIGQLTAKDLGLKQ